MIDNITANHEIPNNWILVDLEQLCDITSGNPAPQNENLFKNGNVPFVRVQDMGRMSNNVYLRETKDYLNNDAVTKNNMKLFPKGSVLFTKSGMSILLNQRAILGSDMHVVSHIGICLPSKYAPSEWIYYWLKSIDFKELTHATTLPSLKLSKVQKIRIPLPPLPEQHRIVAKIEELFTKLDAGVEDLKQVQTHLKRYRQGVLKAAVEGRLTAEWREQHKDELEPADKLLERILKERHEKLEAEQLAKYESQGKTPPKNWRDKYKEAVLPDTSNLPELPKGWIWVAIETISDSLGGFAFKSKDYSENGYQILKIGNVKMNFINLEKSPNYIKNPDCEIIAKYLLAKNDVLITLTGTRRKRDYGFVAIVKNEQKLLLNQRVARLRFSSKVNPNYYTIALQSEEFRDRLFAKETGNVGQGNIGMGAITEEAIPLPTFYEQSEIINEYNRLSSIIDDVEIEIKSELKRAQSLRQSILKRAFEGKLVPLDPNDEPASVLLERIKAEKAKPKKSKQMEMF